MLLSNHVKVVTLFILVLLLLTFVFSSCTKDTDRPVCCDTYVDSEVKEFFINFDEGTSWIFTDSSKSTYDTLVLLENNRKELFRQFGETDTRVDEVYTLKYEMKHQYSFAVVSSSSKLGNGSIKNSVSFTDFPNTNSSLRVENINSNWSLGLGFQSFNQLQLNSKTYNDVLFIDSYVYQFGKIYIARDTGLVAYFSAFNGRFMFLEKVIK